MPRVLRVLVAVAVVATTLFVAQRADAADDTYLWVADGPGNFSDPANWERESDGQPGVPGPDDAARIVAPPGPVTVDTTVTVGSVVVEDAVEDGELDFTLSGGALHRLTTDSLTVSGDSNLNGGVVTHSIEIHGTLDGGQGISVRSDDDVDPPEPGSVVLDSATVQQGSNGSGLFVGGFGPVTFEVRGTEDSVVVGGTTLPAPATIDLVSDEGGAYDGRIFPPPVSTLVGDVPEDALVLGTAGPRQLTWDADEARIDGIVSLDRNWVSQLPGNLIVSGYLALGGSASGGSLEIEAGGTFEPSVWQSDHPDPEVTLTGAFVADPSAIISLDDSGVPCVGDEAVLLRAAGGVTATADEIDVHSAPAWLAATVQPLRNELVAVARRVGDPTPEDVCLDGRSERVVRSMFRDLLGRRADTGGAAYWARQVDDGMLPVTVASRLSSTAEAWTHLVRQTWTVWACDGEPPSDDEVTAGTEFLRSGGSLAVLRADVLGATVPTDSDPVDCLYQAVLGRAPDAGGRAYVEGRLETESLEKVARKFMTTSEGRRVQFTRLYQRLLGRPAEADEVAAGTEQIGDGHSEVWVTAQIAGSSEYTDRASR